MLSLCIKVAGLCAKISNALCPNLFFIEIHSVGFQAQYKMYDAY